MMKKLVALLMALALLCTSIGTFAEEEIVEEPVVAAAVETEEEEVTEEVPEAPEDAVGTGEHQHTEDPAKTTFVKGKYCTDPITYTYTCSKCGAQWTEKKDAGKHKAGKGDQTTLKKKPTCTEEGIILHTVCGGCDIGAWEEKMDATGHSYDATKDKVTDPTCTKDGYVERYCTVCKETITEPGKKATGHKYEKINVDDKPTCTEPGKKGTNVEMCKVCGDVKDNTENDLVEIKPLDHEAYFKNVMLGDYFDVEKKDPEDTNKITGATPKDATQFPKGVCKVDEKVTADGTYAASTITYVAATCTEDGSITFKCSKCEKEYKVVLPALGHDIKVKYYADETAAKEIDPEDLDCVKGYAALYTCKRNCGYSYNVMVQEPKHDFEHGTVVEYLQQKYGDDAPVEYKKNQIAPCIEHWEVVLCANPYCSVTETQHKDATTKTHTPDPDGLYRHTESTCTVLGETAYNCADCLYPQYTEETELKPHTWKEKVTKEATCSETGIRTKTCTVCGKVEEEVIPAIGHDYEEKVIKKADCKNKVVGTKGLVCKNCGDVKESKPYEGHKMVGKPTTKKEPTCTTDGERSFYCSLCCQLVVEVLPATGHSFEYVNGERKGEDKFKADHIAHCDDADNCKGQKATCASANPHGTIHTVVCTFCEARKEKNPAKLTWEQDNEPKHSLTIANGVLKNFMVDVAPTCCKAGSASFTCDLCKETVKGYELPALGHNKTITYDANKGLYVLTCQPLKVGKVDVLKDMLTKAGYKTEVATKVMEYLLKSSVNNFRGIGCDWTEDLTVVAPKYVISVSGSDAIIKLEDPKTMDDIANAYLRVNWRYRLTNGDTVSFNYTFAPNADGSYFIDAPDCDGKLEMTYIEVVGTRTAHRMDLGDYVTYGSKKI